MNERLLRQDAGIRFGTAHVLLIAVLLVAGAVRLGGPETEVLVAVVVGPYCAVLPAALRPVMGLICWAFVTGFVVNELGQLTFTGPDLVRLGVFVAAVPALAAVRPRARARRGTLVL